VLENWVLQRPVLDRFAKHYQTGQPMPQALVNKIEAASTFNQGFATVEYLGSALVDMDLHTRPDGVVDPDRFERETLTRIGMPKEIVMRHRLPQFNHLFTSDAYSAGYYSYLWSDTMAADAWAAFEETGDPFDPTLARACASTSWRRATATTAARPSASSAGRDPGRQRAAEEPRLPHDRRFQRRTLTHVGLQDEPGPLHRGGGLFRGLARRTAPV
jgi:peptidyl-dipeptidase Dcp